MCRRICLVDRHAVLKTALQKNRQAGETSFNSEKTFDLTLGSIERPAFSLE